MSFIIKGFDTDGNCLHCYFQSEDSDRCILTGDDIPLYGKGHPDSCPLVPLPEGHGRLIDADRLAKRLKDFVDWCRDDRREGAFFVMDCPLPDSPTIVPAE